MNVKKAVITAAARGLRLYPAADTVQKSMLPLVDRDGVAKPVLQMIAEEAIDSGIEEICVVCAPGDEEQYLRQFELLRTNLLDVYQGVAGTKIEADRIQDIRNRLRFAVQTEPLGYGHAVYCAREFVGQEPFLLLLSDHLYLSHIANQRCAQQLIALATEQGCAASAVQATREQLVGGFGTLRGKRFPGRPGVYQIEKIIEKPSISVAELELPTGGLRTGHYLCFFGIHVLTPGVFEILERDMSGGARDNGGYQLTPALDDLANRETYLALEVKGTRYDIGAKYGLLEAQVALGTAGKDRDEVLTRLVESLVQANQLGEARRHE